MLLNSLSLYSEYNVAVFVTNQMTADPGAAMRFVIFYQSTLYSF